MGYISLSASAGGIINTVGVWLFFGLVSIFAFWIIGTFIINIPKLRAESAEDDAMLTKGGVSQ